MIGQLERADLERTITEIRTPLTTILGFTGAMLRDGTLSPEQANTLRIVRNESRKIAVLLENLENNSLDDVINTRLDLDVPSLLNELVGFCRTLYPDREFRVYAAARAFPFFTDPEIIRGVLLELLSNAVKFTGPNGRITLKFSETPTEIQIAVFDDGTGIGPEDLPRVGERFFRAVPPDSEPEGTGLGIYLARRRLGLLGGTIEFTSQPGMGTTAILRHPRPDTTE